MHPARLERYDINEAHDDECMFDAIHPCRYQNDCTFQFIIECRQAIASGAFATLRQNKNLHHYYLCSLQGNGCLFGTCQLYSREPERKRNIACIIIFIHIYCMTLDHNSQGCVF